MNLLIFCILPFFSLQLTVLSPDFARWKDMIGPEIGYSVDTQQIAQQHCFKTSIASKNNPISTSKLNESSSFR